MTKKTIAGALALALCASVGTGPDAAPAPEERSQFLFFAVLEGLYEDGVRPSAVESVLAADELVGEPGLFVPGCPICGPIRDALLVYGRGPRIGAWLKVRGSDEQDDPRGFGPGLSEDEHAQLVSVDRLTRSEMFETLVRRWCDRRYDRLRMSDDERGEMRAAIEAGRKQGMAALQGSEMQRRFGDRCPSCDGANAAGERW